MNTTADTGIKHGPHRIESTAHTPGPWSASPFRPLISMGSAPIEGPLMSYLTGNKSSAPGWCVSVASEREADHFLCAAAPDLLKALTLLLESENIKGCPNGHWSTADDVNYRKAEFARAVVRKATGSRD